MTRFLEKSNPMKKLRGNLYFEKLNSNVTKMSMKE